MITSDIKDYLNRSVLCWLATSSSDNVPNVSPKEVFTVYRDESIIIANIASPQTVKNIKANKQVCLSVLEIFIQKGYQLKGVAEIITADHPEYTAMKAELEKLTKGEFPFSSITQIVVNKYKPIIAPSYMMYPDTTTESDQIAAARKAYGVDS
ncbi:MAG: pyridoxamine 5'-phosphate oxidase family protein [Bacteroidota bacterium]